MPRPLPPLRAFEVFSAVLAEGGFGRAARRLGTTQSAVSHQVRVLEQRLGVPLFSRSATGAEPAAAALTLRPFVERGLAALRAGVDRLREEPQGPLVLSVSPSFAAKWLVPRLGGFLARHPAIELSLNAVTRHVDLVAEGVSMAVRHGDGRWPGLEATRLCTEEHLVLCSPARVAGGAGLARPCDLAAHPLLHDRDRALWACWLRAQGLPEAWAERGPVFDQTSLVIDAAVAGQGVALARSALAALDIAAGRLAVPFGPPLPATFAYWIVCPPTARQRRDVELLRRWLLHEARADRRVLRDRLPLPPA
jgi:LysR family glycine cleavage system transcriptional activator